MNNSRHMGNALEFVVDYQLGHELDEAEHVDGLGESRDDERVPRAMCSGQSAQHFHQIWRGLLVEHCEISIFTLATNNMTHRVHAVSQEKRNSAVRDQSERKLIIFLCSLLILAELLFVLIVQRVVNIRLAPGSPSNDMRYPMRELASCLTRTSTTLVIFQASIRRPLI